MSDVTIERVERRVIDNVLLERLGAGGCVAILANEDDLVLMISALRESPSPRAKDMANDFLTLLKSAFPKP